MFDLIDRRSLMRKICKFECNKCFEDCDGMESENIPCRYYHFIESEPVVSREHISNITNDVKGTILKPCWDDTYFKSGDILEIAVLDKEKIKRSTFGCLFNSKDIPKIFHLEVHNVTSRKIYSNDYLAICLHVNDYANNAFEIKKL